MIGCDRSYMFSTQPYRYQKPTSKYFRELLLNFYYYILYCPAGKMTHIECCPTLLRYNIYMCV